MRSVIDLKSIRGKGGCEHTVLMCRMYRWGWQEIMWNPCLLTATLEHLQPQMLFVHQEGKYLFQATGIFYCNIKMKFNSHLMFNVQEKKYIGGPNTTRKQISPTKYNEWHEKKMPGFITNKSVFFTKVKTVLLLT